MLDQQETINCKGRLVSLEEPVVMGILNVTPDSFYDGGRFQGLDLALEQTEKMLNEGALIIDIGGMSSRPGAEIIDEDKELKRTIPVVEAIAKTFPDAIISIDTIKAKIAKEAIQAGAHIVNDISAGELDDELFSTVADLGVPYILMHMKGRPETMQHNIEYNQDDVLVEVIDFLIAKLGQLRNLGVKDVIIDPGFGFGKEIKHNFRLLSNMHALSILSCPILAGVSRKSFIYKTLDIKAQEALTGTIIANYKALTEGAKILRVHDIKEAVYTIQMWKAMN